MKNDLLLLLKWQHSFEQVKVIHDLVINSFKFNKPQIKTMAMDLITCFFSHKIGRMDFGGNETD